MDSKEIQMLMEAYQQVYAPQEEIEEAVKGADTEMRKAAAAERKAGEKRLPPSKGKGYAAQQKQSISWHDKATKGKFIPGMVTNEEAKDGDIAQKVSNMRRVMDVERSAGNKKAADAMQKKINKFRAKNPIGEELDIFDTVLGFLQTEGIAENLEEAQWVMSNLIDEEIIDEILDEATYSAKAARAGKDIGKPGKAFAKIAASAAKRYGSKERGEKVAGAVLAKLRAKKG